MDKRTGIALPLASLYTDDCVSCGDFPALKTLGDFCQASGLSAIQLLPVNDTGTQSSPYSGLSAFALHPLYIRIRDLPEFNDALVNDKAFAKAYKAFEKKYTYSRRFDYESINADKNWLLHLLYDYTEKKKLSGEMETADVKSDSAINSFIKKNPWVIPYAVFKNIKDENMQASWKSWDESFRKMTRSDIQDKWNNKAKKISHRFFVWCQMRAAEQFKDAADYLRSKNIMLKGDMPILLNEDSADCWSWPEFFRQDLRAGSPPDGDNPMGQNWGFPTYDWDRLSADGYQWWKDRIVSASQYYSAFRIDHVLGFFRIWAVSENETSAYLGHTVPYASFGRKVLNELGFEDDRIKWLSYSHIQTSVIEDITWNHDEAVAVLEKVCDRIGTQEMWNFKPEILGDRVIYGMHFFDDQDKDLRVKNALSEKWRDRSLIEIEKNSFIPVYTYQNSTAWKTLSWEEQEKLRNLFNENKKAENEVWKNQATDTLSAIVHASDMTACAEDLGVNLECMPEVLQKLDILSLKVLRWCREWSKDGQPYIPLSDYSPLSVCTTSVHDSSTLRQWWNQEKDSVWAFIRATGLEGVVDGNSAFTPEIAEKVLRASAKCNSALFINPLQDYLFMEHSYYLENEDEERINIPGSVNSFNWTYRLPRKIEDMLNDKGLLNKIKTVASDHDNN